MKKSIKRMISMVLAAIMCMAMCLTGFAAGECSVTVENSIGGVSYSIYKLFDATYTTVGEGEDAETAVSYTFSSNNNSMLNLLQADGSPFTATPSADGTVYVVTLKDGETDTTVATWLNNNAADLAAAGTSAGSDITGNGGSIKWDNLDAGYYLVVPSSSTLSPTLISVTTAAPDGVIVDKNQKPGQGGKDPTDEDWEGGFTKDIVDEDGTSVSINDVTIGDELDYSIRAYAPTYDGEYEIDGYTFTDTMGAGLDLIYDTDPEDGITVEIISSGADSSATWTDITSSCTISVEDGVITVTYDPTEISGYPADAIVKISYSVYVNEEADDADMTNSVHMAWTKIVPTGDEEDPDGEVKDDPTVTVYTYGFAIAKTDGTSPLAGASFTLKDSDENEIKFLYNSSTESYEVFNESVSTSTAATTDIAITTDNTSGTVYVWGLAAGTYTLTEIQAPAGYNILTEPLTITITAGTNGWTVSWGDDSSAIGAFSDTSEPTDIHGVAIMPTVTVVNSAGTTLPGTGGIGTTIFYVVGTLLVLAAAALVVAKMRLGKTE